MEKTFRPRGHSILSFKYAFEGIFCAIKEEPNLKFHLLVATVVILASFIFQLTLIERVIVLVLIGLVIALELTNAAIETVVDSFTEEEHPAAKRAKDISAGAVLVVACSSAVVGLLIFLPHLKLWITSLSSF